MRDNNKMAGQEVICGTPSTVEGTGLGGDATGRDATEHRRRDETDTQET
jgi:hypothetical protein